MEGNINEQQTVLCEINDMTSVVFLSENDLIVDQKILTHRLKYFENEPIPLLLGQTDGDVDTTQNKFYSKDLFKVFQTVQTEKDNTDVR